MFPAMALKMIAIDTSLLVLKNVKVLDLKKGRFSKESNVAISNGKIVSIKFPVRKIKNSRTLDLEGKYIIPGLIDGHVHVTAMMHNNMEKTFANLNYYLQHGITSVRDAAGDGAALKKAQQEILEHTRQGAKVYFSAFMAGDWYYNRGIGLRKEPYQPWEQLITPATNLDSAMKAARQSGATGVKLYHSFDKVLLPKVVEAAKKNGLKVWGHAMMYPATPIEVASSGVEVISHVFMLENLISDKDFHKRKAPFNIKDSVARQFDITPFCKIMKSRHAILDATLCVSEVRDPWIFSLLRKIYAQGVQISAGTDEIVDLKSEHPRLLDELSYFVDKCAFSTIDAIRSATILPAKVIGQENDLGSVKPGKVADLLVLNSDPLADVKSLGDIHMVIQSGIIQVDRPIRNGHQ